MFNSARSSRGTVGMGRDRYGSVGTVREMRMSGFELGIQKVDEEVVGGEGLSKRDGKGDRKKGNGIQITVQELQDEHEETTNGRSLTNSMVSTEGSEWPSRNRSESTSTRTCTNSIIESREWPLRTRSDSVRTLICPARDAKDRYGLMGAVLGVKRLVILGVRFGFEMDLGCWCFGNGRGKGKEGFVKEVLSFHWGYRVRMSGFMYLYRKRERGKEGKWREKSLDKIYIYIYIQEIVKLT